MTIKNNPHNPHSPTNILYTRHLIPTRQVKPLIGNRQLRTNGRKDLDQAIRKYGVCHSGIPKCQQHDIELWVPLLALNSEGETLHLLDKASEFRRRFLDSKIS